MISKSLIGTFVDIKRSSIDDDNLSGFVLDVSDELTLIHYMSDGFHLDGYYVILNSHVTGCDIFDDPHCFQHRALRLKNVRPRKPRGIDISNWTTAFESASKHFPLLAVHQDASDPDTCLVGRIASMDANSITLFYITPNAKWERKTQFLIADVTRLDFGGGYEDALWKCASEDGCIPE